MEAFSPPPCTSPAVVTAPPNTDVAVLAVVVLIDNAVTFAVAAAPSAAVVAALPEASVAVAVALAFRFFRDTSYCGEGGWATTFDRIFTTSFHLLRPSRALPDSFSPIVSLKLMVLVEIVTLDSYWGTPLTSPAVWSTAFHKYKDLSATANQSAEFI